MGECILSSSNISVNGLRFKKYKSCTLQKLVNGNISGGTSFALGKYDVSNFPDIAKYKCNLIRVMNYTLTLSAKSSNSSYVASWIVYPFLNLRWSDDAAGGIAYNAFSANQEFTLSIPVGNTSTQTAVYRLSQPINAFFGNSQNGSTDGTGSNHSLTMYPDGPKLEIIYYANVKEIRYISNQSMTVSFTLEFYTLDTSSFELS